MTFPATWLKVQTLGAEVVSQRFEHRPTNLSFVGSNLSWCWAFFFYLPFQTFFISAKIVLNQVPQWITALLKMIKFEKLVT